MQLYRFQINLLPFPHTIMATGNCFVSVKAAGRVNILHWVSYLRLISLPRCSHLAPAWQLAERMVMSVQVRRQVHRRLPVGFGPTMSCLPGKCTSYHWDMASCRQYIGSSLSNVHRGACWLHCRGPIRNGSILSSGFGSVLALTSRSGVWPIQAPNHECLGWLAPTSSKVLWGLVQSHKHCT